MMIEEEEEEVVVLEEFHRHEEEESDDEIGDRGGDDRNEEEFSITSHELIPDSNKDEDERKERIINELVTLLRDKNIINNNGTSHEIISDTEDSEEDSCRGDRVEGELVVITQQHSSNKPHEIVLDSRDDVEESTKDVAKNNINNEGNGAKENEQTELPKSEDEIPKKKRMKNILKFTKKAPFTPLPSLAPLKESDIPDISTSFFAALREESGIKDPDTLHKKCYETMKVLKENHVLDRYVISEDEAAVLCSIPMLLNDNYGDFSMQKMVESCTEKPPSKLFVMMLTALRKLPRYRGVMYINSENQKKLRTRKKGSVTRPSFCVASKRMNKVNEKTNTDSYREVFNIEEGWGYNISNFVVERNEDGRYVFSSQEGIIIIEPWRAFEVVDSGIQRFEEKISKVPLKMIENELIYEKEIIPNVSTHVVKAIREGIDDVSFVKRMLDMLAFHPFDTEYDNRDTFRDAGGIECLIECYEKHNELIKEVLSCLVNIIKSDETIAYILFNKGFIKTITEIILANINDESLCLCSSLIIFYVIKSIDNSNDGARFFSDIKRFELILALLTIYHSNDGICGFVLCVLIIILSYASIIEITNDELTQFFDSGIFETIGLIIENSEDESTLFMCEMFLKVILVKEFDKYANIDAYIDLLMRKKEAIREKFSSLKVRGERNINLPKKLSINNEPITYDDILAALKRIGVSKPENVLKECKEVIESRWSKISNGYIHSEEEAVLITTYTYESKLGDEMSPYSIINRKLRENDIQDQISDKKSYLRLLLRALRKLPRTKPQTLYRGIIDDQNKYTKEEKLKWNGFSSTSTSMKVTQNFLANKESGKACDTLFEIRGMWGYDISDFSIFSKEQEVLLEPMLSFFVMEITKKDDFTIIVLGTLSNSLLLGNEIPPGCIQHIISILIDNMESKEICAKMCDVLCNLHMDDKYSPNSRKVFKEYNGFKLLCDLFEKHKNSSILNALVRAIDPLDKFINEEVIKSVRMTVGGILIEGTTDEQTTTILLDGLISFKDKDLLIFYNTELFKGLVAVIDRFIENRSLCLKSMKVISYLYSIENEARYIETGAIDVIMRTLKAYADNPAMCEFGCEVLFNIFPGDNNEYKKRAGEEGWVEVLLNILNNHIDNEDICDGCYDNLKKVVQANGIEIVLDVMDKHLDNYAVCALTYFTLASLVINNLGNQEKVKVASRIDNILKVMRVRIDDLVCTAGCYILTFFLIANSSLQKYVYEKGCIDTLLSVIKKYKDDKDTCEMCCGLLAVIFSTNELRSKFCTEDVLNAVRECKEKHNDSNEISHSFLSLIREEDPKVKDAVARGVCTGEAFPKCDDDCELDEIGYCPKCCVQQKVFRCFTCDKDEIKYYCETCWKRDHQGHKGEEFFYPTRCATKRQNK